MVKEMSELPKGLDILFLTNAVYIQNFDVWSSIIFERKKKNRDLKDKSRYLAVNHVLLSV